MTASTTQAIVAPNLAVQMLAFAEGLPLAERAGIDPKLAVEVMTQSAIGSPNPGQLLRKQRLPAP